MYNPLRLLDPLKLQAKFWPQYRFYKQQVEILYSLMENRETHVPAGNMLGKDFVSGFIVWWYFISALKIDATCRILTTSVREEHLGVLWAEIGRFATTSVIPLIESRGGPFILQDLHIRTVKEREAKKPRSYINGLVAQRDEGFSGHHADINLMIGDEASGLDDYVYVQSKRWAKRHLYIGNCNPCQNFWRKAVDRGDVLSEDGSYHLSKIIRIKGAQSPNVILGLKEQELGRSPSNTVLVPGLLTHEEWCIRMSTYNEQDRSESLEAEFYTGKEVSLFPSNWLNLSAMYALQLRGKARVARTLGVDPAEGGDKTAYVVTDEHGVLYVESKKTPDTSVIQGEILALMRKWNIAAENVVIDRGAGKTTADNLRKIGYNVRTVGFGEGVSLDPRRGQNPTKARLDNKEDRYAYVNRRAEMYHELSLLLEPVPGKKMLDDTYVLESKFAIPAEYENLRKELAPIPRTTDGEGRIKLLSKKHPSESDSDKRTLTSVVGHSPDEADALVLAVHGMLHKKQRSTAGAVV